MFVIYVNDLATVIASFKSRYADDTKFGRTISSVADCELLQRDLHSVEEWCKANNLPINAAKGNILTVTNKLNPVVFQYNSTSGNAIPRVVTVKDLGVQVDSNLKFDAHVENIVNKAFKILGFVIRTSRSFKSLGSVLHLYKSLVLLQLEYACQVWSPAYNKYSDAIEVVQRRFTRFVFRKFNVPYCDYDKRLEWLRLISLRRRRMLHDDMFLFKVVHHKIQLNPRIVPICFREENSTRSRHRFVERTWRLRSTFSAPVPRMVRNHNRYFFGLALEDNKDAYRDDVHGILEQCRLLPD